MTSAQAWSVALTVLGASIEVLGIIIAVVEIRGRGSLLREFQAREQQIHLRVASARLGLRSSEVAISPIQIASVEERLDVVEARLADVPEQIRGHAEEAEANAVKYADKQVGDLREDHARDVNRLRDLLVGSVDGNRRAKLGVSALFVGLILQAAGSVVSTLLEA